MTLGFLLESARRHLILLVAALLLGLGGALLYPALVPQTWTASGQLLLGVAGSTKTGSSTAIEYLIARMPTYAALAQSRSVLAPAGAEMGISPEQVSASTSVTVVPSTVVLQISSSGSTPRTAVELNQAVIDSYIQLAPGLDRRSGAPKLLVEQIEPPVAPRDPDQLHGAVLYLVGAIAGLSCGLALALMLELRRLRRRTASVAAVEELPGRPQRIHPAGPSPMPNPRKAAGR